MCFCGKNIYNYDSFGMWKFNNIINNEQYLAMLLTCSQNCAIAVCKKTLVDKLFTTALEIAVVATCVLDKKIKTDTYHPNNIDDINDVTNK